MRPCKPMSAVIMAGLVGAIAAGAHGQEDAAPFVDARSGDPEGRTVVLIPGLASSGEVWADTAAALAEYDVRTLTLAGFAGAPARTDGAPVIAGAAQAIADMLAAEDVRDAALVGHSLGAQIALQAAALAPERVSQVVAVDSAPFYVGLTSPGQSPAAAAQFAAGARAQLEAMSEEAFGAQQAAGLGFYSKDPEFIPTLVEWSAASDRATLIAGFTEVAGGDFRGVLPGVAAPILVLAAWDPAMGVRRDLYEATYADQYSGAPDATVTLIDDSYHFIMHDQEDAFLGALTAFLAEGDE